MTPLFTVRRLPHGEGLPLPSYARPGDAGLDLCSALSECVTLCPGAHFAFPTGFEVAIADGFVGIVHGRSGLAFKQHVVCPHVGVIDSSYRGEIRVMLMNVGGGSVRIDRGDRIAQLVVSPVAECFVEEIFAALPPTTRGANGFGSTGK